MTCDPYWSNVSLLVTGNVTSGGTTFTDSSTVGNVISNPGGNQATSSNQLFGQNTIQCGSGYITTPITANGPLDLYNVTAWTIECWIYTPSLNNQLFIGAGNYSDGVGFWLQTTSSGYVQGDYYYVGSQYNIGQGTACLSANTWTHIALVRNGFSLSVYVNGATAQTTDISAHTNVASWSDSGNGYFYIGGLGGSDFDGQIAEVMVTNGVARYTANFTAPTAPFPTTSCNTPTCDSNWSDVVLYLNMAGTSGSTTFTDTSNVGNTITAISTTVDTGNSPGLGANCADIPYWEQPPFGTYAGLFSEVVTAGSPLDILSSAEDFTIEGFFYAPNNQAVTILDYCNLFTGSGSFNYGVSLNANIINGGTSTFYLNAPTGSGWYNGTGSSTSLGSHAWYHFAIVRESFVPALYINGVQVFIATTDFWYNTSFTLESGVQVAFGCSATESSSNAISLAALKVTKGLARYTASFTPPQPPLTYGSCALGYGYPQCKFVPAAVYKAGAFSNLNGAPDHIYDTPTYTTVQAK